MMDSAYIAASRRSDRSLEARVESARRASEIHKRRTGRALRVTEQDVINEEMYEEEDDELPFQYRRLTAHLQTGSADFNRRLAAYLTNHVAMRTALDQAIASSYAQQAQQFPNSPQLAQERASMFPSPLLNMSSSPMPAQSPAQASPMSGQVASPRPTTAAPAASPTSAMQRPSPYPIPGSAAFQQRSQQRLNPTTQEVPKTIEARRKSTLGQSMMSMSQDTVVKTETTQPTPSGPQAAVAPSTNAQNSLFAPPTHTNHLFGNALDLGPFSMALPAESQLLLGPALDPTDPLSAMFMAGSEAFPSPWSNTTFQQPLTLAPSALDLTQTVTSPAEAPMKGATFAQPTMRGTAPAPSAMKLGTAPAAAGVAPKPAVPASASMTSFAVKPESMSAPLKTTPAAMSVDASRSVAPAPVAAPAADAGDFLNAATPPSMAAGAGLGTYDDEVGWGQFINDILWE